MRLIERRDEASADTVASYDDSHAWTWTSASWIDSAERTGPALALMSTWTSRSRSPVLSGIPDAARAGGGLDERERGLEHRGGGVVERTRSGSRDGPR